MDPKFYQWRPIYSHVLARSRYANRVPSIPVIPTDSATPMSAAEIAAASGSDELLPLIPLGSDGQGLDSAVSDPYTPFDRYSSLPGDSEAAAQMGDVWSEQLSWVRGFKDQQEQAAQVQQRPLTDLAPVMSGAPSSGLSGGGSLTPLAPISYKPPELTPAPSSAAPLPSASYSPLAASSGSIQALIAAQMKLGGAKNLASAVPAPVSIPAPPPASSGGSAMSWTKTDAASTSAVLQTTIGGRSATQYTVRPGEVASNGNRAESVSTSGAGIVSEGTQRTYKWSTFIPDGFVMPANLGMILQFHSYGFPAWGVDIQPARFSKIGVDSIVVNGLSGPKHGDGGVGIVPLPKNQWIDFQLKVTFSSNSGKGYIGLWVNGKQIASSNVATLDGTGDWYTKMGLYRAGEGGQGGTTPGTSVLYHTPLMVS